MRLWRWIWAPAKGAAPAGASRTDGSGPPEAPQPAAEPTRAAKGRRPGAPTAGEIGSEWMLPGVDGGRRLPYADAVIEFVAWLQQRGETGEISRPRLKALYAAHCEDCGLAWLPENYFFQALARHARRHERGVPQPDGRRVRVTTYDIPERPVVRVASQRVA